MLYSLFLYVRLTFILLFIFTNVVQYHLFPIWLSKIIYYRMNKIVIFLFGFNIKLLGNVDNLATDNLVIMCNHYDGMDFFPLFDLFYDYNSEHMLFTIVKDDIVGDVQDQNMLSYIFSLIKDSYLKSSAFIPYKRSDKDSGSQIRNIITNTLDDDNSILIFPEGTSRKDGIPKDFKNGIFELCCEKSFSILPITLKYKKNIGTEKGEPLIVFNWFDNDVELHIHDTIDNCREKKYIDVKDETMESICRPFHT